MRLRQGGATVVEFLVDYLESFAIVSKVLALGALGNGVGLGSFFHYPLHVVREVEDAVGVGCDIVEERVVQDVVQLFFRGLRSSGFRGVRGVFIFRTGQDTQIVVLKAELAFLLVFLDAFEGAGQSGLFHIAIFGRKTAIALYEFEDFEE